jgi:hypothetical protein
MARRLDVRPGIVFVGNAVALRVTVVDQNRETVDMSSWAGIQFDVIEHLHQVTAPVISKVLGSGIVVAGDENEKLVITLDPEDTWDDDVFVVEPGLYHWSVRRSETGVETPIAYGEFHIDGIASRG